jgi:hypothetical protein
LEVVSANRENVLNPSVNPDAKVTSAEKIIIALNGSLDAPNVDTIVNFFTDIVKKTNTPGHEVPSDVINKLKTDLLFSATNTKPQIANALGQIFGI